MINIKFEEPISKTTKIRDLPHRATFIHGNFPDYVFISAWWDGQHYIWELSTMRVFNLPEYDGVTLVDLDITVKP